MQTARKIFLLIWGMEDIRLWKVVAEQSSQFQHSNMTTHLLSVEHYWSSGSCYYELGQEQRTEAKCLHPRTYRQRIKGRAEQSQKTSTRSFSNWKILGLFKSQKCLPSATHTPFTGLSHRWFSIYHDEGFGGQENIWVLHCCRMQFSQCKCIGFYF